MNLKLLGIISLRAAAIAIAPTNAKAAESLNLVATGIQRNQNVDAHMAALVPALESGDAHAWDDVHARIIADGDRLQTLATDTG